MLFETLLTHPVIYHYAIQHLAVLMSDQQGGVQAGWHALYSLTPGLQVQQLVPQQHHRHLVVVPDHFSHLWSLTDRQTDREGH